MSERKPNAMVKFLESLGIEKDAKDPPTCQYCGAVWPFCDWHSIIDESPCRPNPPSEGEGQ